MLELNRLYNMDCMDGMREFPDNFFELAIVDPPYRDTNDPTRVMRKKGMTTKKLFGKKPGSAFFKELFRVSQNQIIWGANNFWGSHLPDTNCFVFWYKKNPLPTYSDGELAWTSFQSPAVCFEHEHSGTHTSDKERIHPTQKPVALYRFLLDKYGKQGDKILDPFAGSASSFIAALEMGFDYAGFEIDPDFYSRATQWVESRKAQGVLFKEQPRHDPESEQLTLQFS